MYMLEMLRLCRMRVKIRGSIIMLVTFSLICRFKDFDFALRTQVNCAASLLINTNLLHYFGKEKTLSKRDPHRKHY